MPITEARTHVLPQELQEAVDVEKLAVPLREKCIRIIEDHGSLEKSEGLDRVFKKIDSLVFIGLGLQGGLTRRSLTTEERLSGRIYREIIKSEDREDHFAIAIMSLGELPPRNANHLLVYVDGLKPYGFLDIGKGKPFLMTGTPDRKVIKPPHTWPQVKVTQQQLAGYSQMVDIVVANLPPRPQTSLLTGF